MQEMIYKPTSTSAREFSAAGRLEEWIHLFLYGEGNNKPFSDGLKIEPRRFLAPEKMNLNRLARCCGPEAEMQFNVPEEGFIKRVGNIFDRYKNGNWDMPPLIVCRGGNGYIINDGNHRYEALKKAGEAQHWVIVWETINC